MGERRWGEDGGGDETGGGGKHGGVLGGGGFRAPQLSTPLLLLLYRMIGLKEVIIKHIHYMLFSIMLFLYTCV